MAEEILTHKYTENNGDIIEIKILKVKKSKQTPEGISYSLVYIRDGKRLIGYDNSKGHIFEGKTHHKHIKNRIIPYDYIDEWKLIEDFNEDIEQINRGTIQ